ncbi:MAG: OB-fold nucleic acid binding domain-containing protein [Candidatus Omnitrophica bacterium]|nr:OB-fold nucleic acid binding domain-containing protein [Candidatus Omnitrophota bacterium]
MEDNDLLKIRLGKIAALKAAGVDLYPNNVRPKNTTAEILTEFGASEAEALAGLKQQFSIAGRLMAVRNFGKAAFVKIQDRKGQIQSYVAKDMLNENAFFVFKKLDIGEILFTFQENYFALRPMN